MGVAKAVSAAAAADMFLTWDNLCRSTWIILCVVVGSISLARSNIGSDATGFDAMRCILRCVDRVKTWRKSGVVNGGLQRPFSILE